MGLIVGDGRASPARTNRNTYQRCVLDWTFATSVKTHRLEAGRAVTLIFVQWTKGPWTEPWRPGLPPCILRGIGPKERVN
jgi:hypothetical protein